MYHSLLIHTSHFSASTIYFNFFLNQMDFILLSHIFSIIHMWSYKWHFCSVIKYIMMDPRIRISGRTDQPSQIIHADIITEFIMNGFFQAEHDTASLI